MSAHKERLYFHELERRPADDWRTLTDIERDSIRAAIHNLYGPQAYIIEYLGVLDGYRVNPVDIRIDIVAPQPAGNARRIIENFGFVSGTLIYWAMERGDWYQWAASPL